jgi:hypothetical protein
VPGGPARETNRELASSLQLNAREVVRCVNRAAKTGPLQREDVMFVANVRHTVAGRPRLIAAFPALAIATLLCVAASAATAQDWSQDGSSHGARVARAGSVTRGPLQVSVRVAGRSIPLYQGADRTDRWYLQAKEGANYEVTVRNLTGARVGFVIAVDGLNAINGLRSHVGADEPMYVLDGYGATTIKGWRKDLGNVSKFQFVDERSSYAARTDQANGDLGWIRVAAFNEVRPVAWIPRAWGNQRMNYRDGGGGGSAPAAPAPAPSNEPGRGDANGVAPERSLVGGRAEEAPLAKDNFDESSPGTGWGANQRDAVREVDFKPERYAAGQVILRYEYADALQRLGILPWSERGRDRLWERENGQLGFAQPPTHW